jgi:hypothetical protein
MIDRRLSRAAREVRPLRLRHQEALIRREMRRLVERPPGRCEETGDGALRRRRSMSSGTGEVAETEI